MHALEKKISVVTGGTRGIGLATVKKFLAEGARVVLWGSRQSSAQEAVKLLKYENPVAAVEGDAPDLSDPMAVADALESVRRRHGRLDILVNNAGASSREPLQSCEPQAFDRLMALNVNAVFYCSKAAARLMMEQGEGVILNTSSMAGLYGQPAGCGYPASKWAVNGLTKSLARELGKYGIRVNAVAPGIIRTGMVEGLPAKMLERITGTIPLGRMGSPEDVAEAFAFLAGDGAAYITGAVLSVDGGAIL